MKNKKIKKFKKFKKLKKESFSNNTSKSESSKQNKKKPTGENFEFNENLYGKKSNPEENENEENESAYSHDSEENDDNVSNISDIHRLPLMDQNTEDIEKYYEYLRKQFAKSGNIKQWEDPEFPDDPNLLLRPNADLDAIEKIKNIEFERPDEEQGDGLHFFEHSSSSNFNYEFMVHRGDLNDKFLVGTVLMLFKRREEFFLNLVVDYENVIENIKAGFCGFRFFINGEWVNVTIDTRLPWPNGDNMTLSSINSLKPNLWLSLFEKAYAKVNKSYDVLNNVSIKNVLVDLTGGVSKKIEIKDKMEDIEKKNLFEEMRRCVQQKYLMGCMKFDENEEDVRKLK